MSQGKLFIDLDMPRNEICIESLCKQESGMETSPRHNRRRERDARWFVIRSQRRLVFHMRSIQSRTDSGTELIGFVLICGKLRHVRWIARAVLMDSRWVDDFLMPSSAHNHFSFISQPFSWSLAQLEGWVTEVLFTARWTYKIFFPQHLRNDDLDPNNLSWENLWD